MDFAFRRDNFVETIRIANPLYCEMTNWALRRHATVPLALFLIPAALSATTILYSNLDPGGYSANGAYNTGSFSGTTFKTTAGGNLLTVSLVAAVNQSSSAPFT